MIYKTLNEDHFEMSFNELGFYHVILKAGEEIEVSDIRQIEDFVLDNHEGIKRPFLLEMSYGVSVGEGVGDHLKEGETRNSTADAIVIESYAHKLMVQFYLKFKTPSRPTKVFSTRDEGIAWISEILAKEN